jgi:hypothetical protein
MDGTPRADPTPPRSAQAATPIRRSHLAEKAALTRGYLDRKSQEYEALKDEIDKIKAELASEPRP